MTIFNLYCDESCHLEHDQHRAMVLGTLCCPDERRKLVGERFKALKSKHGIGPHVEVKWVKVSPAKIEFYLELVDLFFESNELTFRAVIIPDKTVLKHAAFTQTHDEFYYKMWYLTLTHVLSRKHRYQIYLDKKDTRSEARAHKLCEVLSNSKLDFKGEIIARVQHVQSHEVPLMQIADLLIGATSYANRGITTSAAKQAVIERIRKHSHLRLTQTTLLKEEKLNLFVWQSNFGVPQ